MCSFRCELKHLTFVIQLKYARYTTLQGARKLVYFDLRQRRSMFGGVNSVMRQIDTAKDESDYGQHVERRANLYQLQKRDRGKQLRCDNDVFDNCSFCFAAKIFTDSKRQYPTSHHHLFVTSIDGVEHVRYALFVFFKMTPCSQTLIGVVCVAKKLHYSRATMRIRRTCRRKFIGLMLRQRIKCVVFD